MNKNIFVTARTGSYFSLSKNNFSHYQGLFFMLRDELEEYKVVEDVKLDDEFLNFEYKADKVFRINKNSSEKFYFEDSSSLVYEVKGYSGFVNVSLDFRRVHDFCDKGRIYEFEKVKGGLRVIYNKYSDDSLNELVESRVLFIKGVEDFVYDEVWEEKSYVYDLKRKTRSNFFVNRGLKLKVNESCKFVFLFDEKPLRNRKKVSVKNDLDKAFFALDSLRYDDKFKGLFAGFPWFYQFWARDELISLKPYIIRSDKSFVRSVLFRNFDRIDNGLVKNRYPESDLGSIDSLGWLCTRFFEAKSFFNNKELKVIREKLVGAINDLEPRIKNELLFNFELETWMDTSNEDDFREGFRVEIQALFLAVFRALNYCNKKLGLDVDSREDKLRKLVKDRLFKDYLRDGFNKRLSNTIRPNVFLAYYVYKDFLSKQEWEVSFDKVISECFLDWGGFSSISKNHRLFKEEYTGITNESYHRGDSWFFVNNIAAICLFDLNKKKYAKYISKIKDASLFEMNESGALGHCAEVSSAKEIRSEGTFAQAWSAATLYELLSCTNEKL
ncbi:MAG: amylo-alpha-1,6-glucosidase [Candidatus Woesearchaeota archaeon]